MLVGEDPATDYGACGLHGGAHPKLTEDPHPIRLNEQTRAEGAPLGIPLHELSAKPLTNQRSSQREAGDPSSDDQEIGDVFHTGHQGSRPQRRGRQPLELALATLLIVRRICSHSGQMFRRPPTPARGPAAD
jgi:hypothetical protein